MCIVDVDFTFALSFTAQCCNSNATEPSLWAPTKVKGTDAVGVAVVVDGCCQLLIESIHTTTDRSLEEEWVAYWLHVLLGEPRDRPRWLPALRRAAAQTWARPFLTRLLT